MSYSKKKAAPRSTKPIKDVAKATGKKKITVPDSASRQLRITVSGELKNPLNSYSNTLAPKPKGKA